MNGRVHCLDKGKKHPVWRGCIMSPRVIGQQRVSSQKRRDLMIWLAFCSLVVWCWTRTDSWADSERPTGTVGVAPRTPARYFGGKSRLVVICEERGLWVHADCLFFAGWTKTSGRLWRQRVWQKRGFVLSGEPALKSGRAPGRHVSFMRISSSATLIVAGGLWSEVGCVLRCLGRGWKKWPHVWSASSLWTSPTPPINQRGWGARLSCLEGQGRREGRGIPAVTGGLAPERQHPHAAEETVLQGQEERYNIFYSENFHAGGDRGVLQ